MINISIVIPILNEAKNIKLLIPKIDKEKKKLRLKKFEILIIDDNSEDNIKKVFINVKKKLDTKIRSKEFTLSIIENYYSNSSLDDTFDHYEELNFRHYVIYYSSLLAFENTESKNAVECGSADGMGIYFCISNYIKDKKSKIYLYDSWETMRDKELKTEKDLTRKGDYHYLDEKIIKNNLEKFSKFIIYNKGFIPET